MNLKLRLGIVCTKLYVIFWNDLGKRLKTKKFNFNWFFIQQLILFGFLRIIFLYVSLIVKSELEVFKIFLQAFAINYLIFYVTELKIFYIIICIFMIYMCIQIGEELYKGNSLIEIKIQFFRSNWYKMDSMFGSIKKLLNSEKKNRK